MSDAIRRVDEVHAFRVSYACPSCGIPLQMSQIALLSDPPMYHHHCPQCGYATDTKRATGEIVFARDYKEAKAMS